METALIVPRTVREVHTARQRARFMAKCRQHAALSSACTSPIRARQIASLRLRTETSVAGIELFTDCCDPSPEHKRPALSNYMQEKKGCPSRGS